MYESIVILCLLAQQILNFKLNKYFCNLDVAYTAFKTRMIMDRLT